MVKLFLFHYQHHNLVKKKHITIPIFVPEEACPNRCVFCNQYSISDTIKAPTEKEVIDTIEAYLKTVEDEETVVEVGFFGGNFTGIDVDQQKSYLNLVQPYLDNDRINSIRLSTRPDYIDDNILALLKDQRVETIELGLQSMDEDVLKVSGRGHTASDAVKAAKLINKKGFKLGLQMMIGLPEDSKEKSISTAKKIIELKAKDVRIYPTLVVKNTKLETWFKEGKYVPLTIEDAVEWSKEIVIMLENKKINIIRMGLHPSEDLTNNSGYIAGPFHQSFRELVYTEIWGDALNSRIMESDKSCVQIYVPVKELNYAIGYNGKNKQRLEEVFERVNFKADHKLHGRHFYVDYY